MLKREACLADKFRLLVLLKLKRDCCWLGTDCLFRSLKYPNCSTPWKVSHWSNISVVRPPQPTPLVNCAACTQAVHIFWGPWKQAWAQAQGRAFWTHLYPFIYIYITNIQFYIFVAIYCLVTARNTFISQDSNYLIWATL